VTTKALVTGAAETAPVVRDRRYLVRAREAAELVAFSPVPGERFVVKLGPAAAALAVLAIAHLTEGSALWLGALLPFAAFAALWSTPGLLQQRVLLGRRSRRLRGTVELAEGAARAPTLDRDAVVIRTIFWEPKAAWHQRRKLVEEIRGVPFLLRLPDGRAARVEPTEIHLLEKLERLPDPPVATLDALGAEHPDLFPRPVRQSVISPGDQLEVAARLESEVAHTGNAAPARGTPLVTRLRPHTGKLIWARRLPP
jgi:hypothetical protein